MIWLLVSLASCGPQTGTDDDQRQLTHEVDVLVGGSARAADIAQQLLIARSPSAIAIVETGIYEADERGRLRIVKTLVGIADPEVVPILRHLVRVDDSTLVRQAALAGLAELGIETD